MSHKEIQMLMSSYVDDEISDIDEPRVLEHLEVCAECRQFIKNAKEIREGIRLLDEIDLPSAFASRLAHVTVKRDEHIKEWLGIEPLARNAFYAFAVIVLAIFFVLHSDKNVAPGIADVLIDGSGGDSVATQVLLQPGDLTKNDLLYAVMTK
jgi:hypothetical protein